MSKMRRASSREVWVEERVGEEEPYGGRVEDWLAGWTGNSDGWKGSGAHFLFRFGGPLVRWREHEIPSVRHST
jgi:hypothetical protein